MTPLSIFILGDKMAMGSTGDIKFASINGVIPAYSSTSN